MLKRVGFRPLTIIVAKRRLNKLNVITEYPELMKEWLYEKNKGVNPKKISKTSSKRLWWKCSNGHEYMATISRKIEGRTCPFCSGDRAITGVNDLSTSYPELIKDWDYDKNSKNKINPTKITTKYTKEVWWRCGNNHSYQETIENKIKDPSCPFCYFETSAFVFLKIIQKIDEGKTIVNEIEMDYFEYVDYLLNKYGKVNGDYFIDEDYKIQNSQIKRSYDGLEIHHVDEIDIPLLSCGSPDGDFSHQKAERLVYADKIEHLLLHIKIEHINQKYNNGLHILAKDILKYYQNPPTKGWERNMYKKIEKRIYDFMFLILYYKIKNSEFSRFEVEWLIEKSKSENWDGLNWNDLQLRNINCPHRPIL